LPQEQLAAISRIMDKYNPREQIAKVHAYIDKGHKKGNVVIHVSHN